jgi:hypothetical protein
MTAPPRGSTEGPGSSAMRAKASERARRTGEHTTHAKDYKHAAAVRSTRRWSSQRRDGHSYLGDDPPHPPRVDGWVLREPHQCRRARASAKWEGVSAVDAPKRACTRTQWTHMHADGWIVPWLEGSAKCAASAVTQATDLWTLDDSQALKQTARATWCPTDLYCATTHNVAWRGMGERAVWVSE